MRVILEKPSKKPVVAFRPTPLKPYTSRKKMALPIFLHILRRASRAKTQPNIRMCFEQRHLPVQIETAM